MILSITTEFCSIYNNTEIPSGDNQYHTFSQYYSFLILCHNAIHTDIHDIKIIIVES